MKRRAPNGFTLLETLAVLAIVALVAGLAIPAIRPPSDGMRLEDAARRMASAIRLARARAILHGAENEFSIDVEARTYASPGMRTTALPPGAIVAVTFAASRRKDDATGSILFYPDGGATGAEIALRLGAARTKINVDWLTGDAEIVR